MMEQSRSKTANRRLIFAGIFFYFVLTAAIGGGVLWLTLWSYAAAGEALSDTTSAAILNTTAATLLWLAFFGGLDMFLTLWTLMQTRQMEAERQHREETERAAREAERQRWEEAERENREADRAAREADRAAREAERISRAQELADQRAFQQGIIEMLTAEREQNRQEREQNRQERENSRQERQQFLETLQAERERGDLLMTRFLDLAERLGNRNGNGASDKG